MNKFASMMIGAVALFASMGCSTTVRTMTARTWMEPAGAPPSASNPATASGDGALSGQVQNASAVSGAPGATAGQIAATGMVSQYYLSYWEGHCKPILGCGRGDTHIKRCKVNADNTVACVEEPIATKALNPAD